MSAKSIHPAYKRQSASVSIENSDGIGLILSQLAEMLLSIGLGVIGDIRIVRGSRQTLEKICNHDAGIHTLSTRRRHGQGPFRAAGVQLPAHGWGPWQILSRGWRHLDCELNCILSVTDCDVWVSKFGGWNARFNPSNNMAGILIFMLWQLVQTLFSTGLSLLGYVGVVDGSIIWVPLEHRPRYAQKNRLRTLSSQQRHVPDPSPVGLLALPNVFLPRLWLHRIRWDWR